MNSICAGRLTKPADFMGALQHGHGGGLADVQEEGNFRHWETWMLQLAAAMLNPEFGVDSTRMSLY
jgi:hypothetical protein